MGHLLVLVMPDVGGPIGVRLEHSDRPARNVNRRHEQGVVGAQGYTDPRMVDNSGRNVAGRNLLDMVNDPPTEEQYAEWRRRCKVWPVDVMQSGFADTRLEV